MKKIIMLLVAVATGLAGIAQATVRITAEAEPGVQVTRDLKDKANFPVKNPDLKSFGFLYNGVAANHKLTISVAGVTSAGSSEYLQGQNNTSVTYTFNDKITNKEITIKDVNTATNAETDLLTFKFIQAAGTRVAGSGETDEEDVLEPLANFAARFIADFELTKTGWIRVETAGMTPKEKRENANVTHMFFDEFGNNLLGTIPQGISNRQYVAHIIYKGYSDREGVTRYSVKQKTGSFSSALNVNNQGILSKLPNNLQGGEEEAFGAWKVADFPLGIATDDLTFDIMATTIDDKGKPAKGVLETHTIKMAPVYHATIDVGLINSELRNANFSLVDAPDGSGNKVVQETDRSPKGIVTVMATFYTSPVVMIKRLINRDEPDYKLTGRSYFDDHSLLERIYPTIGVSVSNKSFENLFFGLNWEVARGLSVFGGGHWGKVNVFQKPGYVRGTTPVTQAEFDFYKNTSWDVDWAYGVKLDLLIVTNLFK
jgi:hypothetical protein